MSVSDIVPEEMESGGIAKYLTFVAGVIIMISSNLIGGESHHHHHH